MFIDFLWNHIVKTFNANDTVFSCSRQVFLSTNQSVICWTVTIIKYFTKNWTYFVQWMLIVEEKKCQRKLYFCYENRLENCIIDWRYLKNWLIFINIWSVSPRLCNKRWVDISRNLIWTFAHSTSWIYSIMRIQIIILRN